MTTHTRLTAASLALILLAALLMGGCAATSQEAAAPAEAAPAAEPEWAIEPWDGHGLDIPLDGTSMAAWERSLRSVKAYSEPGEYAQLLRAIDYLKVYDIGAGGDMERLVKRLNGLTGYQVLARVGYRRPPVRGTAPGTEPNDPD